MFDVKTTAKDEANASLPISPTSDTKEYNLHTHLESLKSSFINELMHKLLSPDLKEIQVWNYSFEHLKDFKGIGIQEWKTAIEDMMRDLLNSDDKWMQVAKHEGLKMKLVSQDINPDSKPRVIDIKVLISRQLC